MANFETETSLTQLIHEVGDHFVVGAITLESMLRTNERPTYPHWSAQMQVERHVASERLAWVWDSLRVEPELKLRFGDLPAAGVPWTTKNDKFQVFGSGARFVIGMKATEVRMLLYAGRGPAAEERVVVRTEKTLFMRPGKADRLECCDCMATVTVQVPETYSLDREADIMRIDKERITLGDRLIKVRVDSLNQAYTVSSRRLEPDRRSHGGRTYDHVVHVGEKGRMRLEDIRRYVESGDWRVPEKQGETNTPEHDNPTSGESREQPPA